MFDVQFFVIALSMLVYCLFAGMNAAKRKLTIEEYFLAGRKVSFFPLLMTFFATQFGGGAVVGTMEMAYSYGWISLCFVASIAIGLVFIALWLGQAFSATGAVTVSAILEKAYRSPALRKLSSLLMVLFMSLILIGLARSMIEVFAAAGLDSNAYFMIFWGILIYYTMSGGLRAVIFTDVLQAIFILLVFSIVACFILVDVKFDLSYFILHREVDYTILPWVSWLLMPMFFVFISQDMVQRCCAGTDRGAIGWAALFAAILLILAACIPVIFGILMANNGYQGNQHVLVQALSFMGNNFPLLSGWFVCAVIVAIISSADSTLCAASSNLIVDFGIELKHVRVVTMTIGIASGLMAYIFEGVIDVMLMAHKLASSSLVVPILGALVLKKTNRLAAWVATVTGGFVFLVTNLTFDGIMRDISGLIAALFSYCIVYVSYPNGSFSNQVYAKL